LVSVGCSKDTVWVRVEGRGTFQNSGGLKAYAQEMIGRGFNHFVVDLGECEMMDSTFMGMLTSICLRLRDANGGHLEVVGASLRNASLLSNLGLDQLFSVKPQGDPTAVKLPAGIAAEESDNRPATSGEMRLAHEALAEAVPENAVRFRDVLELLQAEPGGKS
jgi:anti-sigma B factor antagonist